MIISANKNGIDNVVYDFAKYINSPLPIVIVTRMENFIFNDELLKLDDYCLIDFTEYGYDWDMKVTHLFGRNTYFFRDKFEGVEWERFDNWVDENRPLVYFKRELLKQDKLRNVFPLQYPCNIAIEPPQTREQFEQRLFLFNFVWGLSHESRKSVHGDVWRDAGKHGYVVCDNLHNLQQFIQHENNPKKALTINTPYYARWDMSTITDVNRLSKIVFSLGGAGRCCFRHTEITNSIMLMWKDDICWSHEWNETNCILSEEGKEVETAIDAINHKNLYEIYCNGVENVKNYHIDNYIPNYIEKTIREYI